MEGNHQFPVFVVISEPPGSLPWIKCRKSNIFPTFSISDDIRSEVSLVFFQITVQYNIMQTSHLWHRQKNSYTAELTWMWWSWAKQTERVYCCKYGHTIIFIYNVINYCTNILYCGTNSYKCKGWNCIYLTIRHIIRLQQSTWYA